nr:putative nucleotidyltransferase, ribonuclease H [Tanacetum cinerariifolium]
MVNSRQLVAPIDDSLKNHIAESVAAALDEQVNKSIDALNQSVKGVCTRQDYLCAEIKKLSSEASTSTTPNRSNNPKISIMAKIEFPKFSENVLLGGCIDGRCVVRVYVEALLKRFCSTYEDPMTDLKNISQKGGLVQVYIDSFDILMNKVEVPEAQAISIRSYEDKNGEQFYEGVFGYDDIVVENRVGKSGEINKPTDAHPSLSPLLHKTCQTLRVGAADHLVSQLYAKISKYVFGTTQVEYLGHVISSEEGSTYASKEFVMETDASDEGIGAVLQQMGHLIAFLCRSLAPKHKGLSIYEKELWAVVYALEKWR